MQPTIKRKVLKATLLFHNDAGMTSIFQPMIEPSISVATMKGSVSNLLISTYYVYADTWIGQKLVGFGYWIGWWPPLKYQETHQGQIVINGKPCGDGLKLIEVQPKDRISVKIIS